MNRLPLSAAGIRARQTWVCPGQCLTVALSGVAGLLTFEVGSVGHAAEDVRDKVEAFFSQHCYECHDDLSSKGGLNLLDLDFDLETPGGLELWEHIHDRVESGEMPPKEEPRPDADDVETFVTTLHEPLLAHELADVAAYGRVQGRRLTRREYEHTVHDLLGIDLPLAELLPEDPPSHGFETVADGQQLSHFNLAAYLEVADLALDEAFRRVFRGDAEFKRSVPAPQLGRAGHRGGNYRGPETRDDRSLHYPIRLQFYGRMPATTVPESGWYRVTLKDVEAVNPKTGVVWGTLRSGECASNAPMMYPVGIVGATRQKRDMVYEAWIREGHRLELKPNDATLKVAPTGASGGNVGYQGRDLVKQGFAAIAVTGIEIERIYPNATRWQVGQQLFGDVDRKALAQPGGGEQAEALVMKAMRHFAPRAFRRPVGDEELAPWMEIASDELAKPGTRPGDALRAVYRGMLCSPRFLTFIEEPGRLDDHALASRLSYMLWNSIPDARLRELADAGQLSDGKIYHGQVSRMLDDPKAERFIASFTDQWLNLKDIDFTTPDSRLYQTFDPVVQDSMVAETRAFFRELIIGEGTVRHLIDADFAMLNERLARFYGIGGQSDQPATVIQRVSLKPGDRGGLVTQGAVLKVTADGTVTSPVIRGVFVGERILGLHIPPPPPGVPAVEPDIRGTVSIRDQLAKHSNSESCAACHEKIDPAGFALETFDPVGLPRTKYGTQKNAAKVDPSGVTPDGKAFDDTAGWKAIYVAQPERLARNFAAQLLTYATGSPPRFSDREGLDAIAERAREKDFRLRALVHAVVASDAFRRK